MSVKWNGWVLHYTVHWLATINRARGTTVGACSQHAYCLNCFHAFEDVQLSVNLTKLIRMTFCILFTRAPDLTFQKTSTYMVLWKEDCVTWTLYLTQNIRYVKPLIIKDDKEI